MPINSIKEIGNGLIGPWDIPFIKVGKRIISLGDIEHRILRKLDEPRIHFAINCASTSCPRLLNEAYTTKSLEEMLKNQTQAFLSDTTKNKISNNEIKLSRIFKWFENDFTKQGSLISFINKYGYFDLSQNAEIQYLEYDWNLNKRIN